MLFLRRSLLMVGLLLTLFVAACGTTATDTAGTNNTMTSKTNSTMTGNGQTAMNNPTPTAAMMPNNPMPTATPAANMQGGNMGGNMDGNNAALIHTTKVTINGKMVMVLTDAKGMILYYKLNDPRPNSNCTGACAKDWPPVIAMTAMITSSMTLPHKLTTHMTGNGNQVLYDGHPLYTYAADMAPGKFTGRGQDNVWYLVGIGL